MKNTMKNTMKNAVETNHINNMDRQKKIELLNKFNSLLEDAKEHIDDIIFDEIMEIIHFYTSKEQIEILCEKDTLV